MKIQQLTPAFYKDKAHLVELLTKNRGYGLVLLPLNNIDFGIPLRSRMTHRHGFNTVGEKGLDYGKAVIFDDPTYVSVLPFKIPVDEYKIINANEKRIQREFEHYVDRYVSAVQKNDTRILGFYQYSTLQNYHKELGI